jgi:hypothetical protein
MKGRFGLATVAGVLSLLATGLPLSCEEIVAGTLTASPQDLSPVSPKTFAVGTTVSSIWSALDGATLYGTRTIRVTGGSYGNKTGLTELRFESETRTGSDRYYSVHLFFKDYTSIYVTNSQEKDAKITSVLIVGGSTSGKRINFGNLPEGEPANGIKGDVYTGADGYLRVKR